MSFYTIIAFLYNEWLQILKNNHLKEISFYSLNFGTLGLYECGIIMIFFMILNKDEFIPKPFFVNIVEFILYADKPVNCYFLNSTL